MTELTPQKDDFKKRSTGESVPCVGATGHRGHLTRALPMRGVNDVAAPWRCATRRRVWGLESGDDGD